MTPPQNIGLLSDGLRERSGARCILRQHHPNHYENLRSVAQTQRPPNLLRRPLQSPSSSWADLGAGDASPVTGVGHQVYGVSISPGWAIATIERRGFRSGENRKEWISSLLAPISIRGAASTIATSKREASTWLKDDGQSRFALKWGDAQFGSLNTIYAGALPQNMRRYVRKARSSSASEEIVAMPLQAPSSEVQ